MPREIIKYLKTHVKNSIINDVKNVAIYHAIPRRKSEAGFFNIPRQVFCYGKAEKQGRFW